MHSHFLRSSLAVLVAVAAQGAANVVDTPLRSCGLGSLQLAAFFPDGKRFLTAGESGAFVWQSSADLAPSLSLDRPPVHVVKAAISPDGSVILTAGRDRLVRAWGSESGQVLSIFDGHRSDITGLAFSRDGSRFASCSGDNTVVVREFSSGKVQVEIVVPGAWFADVAFSPNDRFLAACEALPGNAVRLWDAASGEPLRVFLGHTNEVRAIGFLSDGRFVTGGVDKTVRVWDPETGALTRTLGSTASPVVRLALAADGSFVAACDEQGTLVAWNPDTGALLRTIPPVTTVHSLAAIPGSNQLAAAGSDERLRIYDLGTGELLRTLEGHTGSSLQSVSFSPDGQEIVVGGTEPSVRVWAAGSGAQEFTMANGSSTSTAVFSPDGSMLLTDAGVPQPVARLWNRRTGLIEREFKGHTGWLLATAFSRDGTRIVTGAADGTARIWNAGTGVSLRTLGHADWVTAVAFSPDGALVATGTGGGTTRLWDAETGSLVRSSPGIAGRITSIDFHGDLIMTAAENGLIEIRQVTTGELRREVFPLTGFLNQALFSPDGTFVLTAEGWPFFGASLWDARTGELLRVFTGHTWPVESVAFSSSGHMIATGSDRLRLWNVADLTSRLRLRREAAGLEVQWNFGILQRADSPDGVWQDVPDAASPHRLTGQEAAGFFRVKTPVP